MKKAGGIIAIIAGVFAWHEGERILFLGNLAEAFGGKAMDGTILVCLAALCTIYGTVCVLRRKDWPGWVVAGCAFIGILAGAGDYVLFMFFALGGGILAAIGARRELRQIASCAILALGVAFGMAACAESAPAKAQLAPPNTAAAEEEADDQEGLFTEPLAEIRKDILARCRSQMESFGASLVKVCADEELKAYNALNRYDSKHLPVIQRCKRQMLSLGGWTIVQVCVDEDIAAEKALEDF